MKKNSQEPLSLTQKQLKSLEFRLDERTDKKDKDNVQPSVLDCLLMHKVQKGTAKEIASVVNMNSSNLRAQYLNRLVNLTCANIKVVRKNTYKYIIDQKKLAELKQLLVEAFSER